MLALIDEQTQSTAANAKTKFRRGKDNRGTIGATQLARNVFMHVFLSATNKSGGNLAPTAGDILDQIKCLFASWYMDLGLDTSKEAVDIQLPPIHMRLLMAMLTGRDSFWVKNFVTGNWAPLSSLASGTPVGPVVANNADAGIEFQFVRSFEIDRFPTARYDYCPGKTQLDSMYIEITRGPTFSVSGNWVQDGLANIRMVADVIDAANLDKWASLPRIARNADKGLYLPGPTGLLFAAYDFSYPQNASPLTNYELQRAGDDPLLPNVTLNDWIAALWREQGFLADGFDVSSQATCLWRAPTPFQIAQMPTGSFVLHQPNDDLTAPDIAWIYCPQNTPDRLAVAKDAATQFDTRSVASFQTTASTSLPANVTATAAFSIVGENDAATNPQYSTAIGLPVQRGQPVPSTPSVPAPIKTQLKGHAAPSAAHATAVSHAVAQRVVGGTSVSRVNPRPSAPSLALSLGLHSDVTGKTGTT